MTAGCSFQLSRRDIHVWAAQIGASAKAASNFEHVLSSDERDRAMRFRFDHLRHSFVIARGVLRCLLGRYIGREPASVRFSYGARGKPALALATDLDFNAAHSGGLALFAITVGCPLGVDLEEIHSLTDMLDIARRLFCLEEFEEMMSLPGCQRKRAFFDCWTRKEAYIKATGDGLSVPLNEFRVALKPGDPVRFIHVAYDKEIAKAWSLHNLPVEPGYAGALAYHEQPRNVSNFSITDPTQVVTD